MMTRHMQDRMNQRGITGDLVELVAHFGDWSGDRLVLDRKALKSAVHSLDALRATMLKALDKGGLAVVEADGQQITTYAIRRKPRK
jgi:ferric-dicitrate binding protein FerR (iron transport regulator)